MEISEAVSLIVQTFNRDGRVARLSTHPDAESARRELGWTG